jgi:hypothetical protein
VLVQTCSKLCFGWTHPEHSWVWFFNIPSLSMFFSGSKLSTRSLWRNTWRVWTLVDPSWVTFDWGTPFCSSKTAVLTADNQAKGWIQRKLWMSRISFPWRTNLTCHLPARIRVVEYIFWGCQRAGLSNCVYIRINICMYILYVCQSSLLDAAPATIRWRRQRQAFPRFLLPGTNLMIRSLKLWMLKSGFNFLTVFLRHHDGGYRLVLTLVVLDKSRFAFFCWTQFMRLRFNCS